MCDGVLLRSLRLFLFNISVLLYFSLVACGFAETHPGSFRSHILEFVAAFASPEQ